MTDSVFLTRVVLHQYKSIAGCDVRLSPMTYLLGSNGSGKSNFVDAQGCTDCRGAWRGNGPTYPVAASPRLVDPDSYTDVQKPIRVHRDRFLNKDEDFLKYLRLASAKAENSGWILILLDADDDCPAELGPGIVNRACNLVPHCRIVVVLPKREYEAWFLASADSLDGKRGFVLNGHVVPDPETPRNPKGWLSRHMPNGTYREVTDQPAFSAEIDLEQVRHHSRSFRKLCSEWIKRAENPS